MMIPGLAIRAIMRSLASERCPSLCSSFCSSHEVLTNSLTVALLRSSHGLLVRSSQGMVKELRSALMHLYDESALGSAAVLIWAEHITELGHSSQLMKILEGDWIKKHQVS